MDDTPVSVRQQPSIVGPRQLPLDRRISRIRSPHGDIIVLERRNRL
jgi:hypothetical protein